MGPAAGDVDGFEVAVELERIVAAFTADAARLHASKRGAQVAHVLGVDPAHAGVDRVRHAVRSPNVVGPHVGGEAVRGRVGQADGVGLVAERHGDQDRSEDLLAEHPHRLVHLADDRRREVVALGPVGRSLTAGEDARALLPRGVDVVAHPCVMLGVNKRAEFGRLLERVSNPDPPGARGDRLDDLLVGRRLDEQARARRAPLPVQREDLRESCVNALFAVRVGEDDDG